MSTDETTAPKRRSSTAKRRRSSRPTTPTVAPEAEEVQQATVAPVETAEVVDRNAQRAAERKAAKAKRDQKSGIGRVVDTKRFQGVQNFYDDTMSEIRKVIWPTRQQTINLTLLVMALALVVGVLLGGLDWTMLKIFEAIG